MSNLWLVPASDEPSTAHLFMSLAKPMSEETRTKLGTPFEFAWGARSGPQNDGRFEILAPGDTCVFYTRSFSGNGGNKYCLAANIVGKMRSREAGETIWQDPNFELVYFVDKPRRISISPKEISAAFSPYRPDYFANAPQSWTRVDEGVVAGLVRDFGSVGAWLERVGSDAIPARRFWWVNQGKTYEKAKSGGFIWAPKHDSSGSTPFHWENLRRVSPGDIVFNYADTQLRAVSIVKSSAYDSDRGALPGDWGKDGWRSDLAYHELARPVSITLLGSKIRDLDLSRGPINRSGSVNQGYLYELSDQAARIILEEIGAENIPSAIREALNLNDDFAAAASFASLLRRYYDEQIIFVSSVQNQRYAIAACDDSGVSVERLDAHEPQRVTFVRAGKLIQRIQDAGGLELSSLDGTVAIRTTILQAESLALTGDHKRIVFLPDNASRLQNFLQVLSNLNMVSPFYKPAMLLCVLDGIDTGQLSANRIPFDWIAPRFIAKLKELGKEVTEREAAQPFYHLTGDLIWLHAVPNRADLMQDGADGPAAARRKINYALLKDTYWNLLQDAACRSAVRRQLETIMTPKPSADQLLPAAESAVANTGFVHSPDLVRRFISSILSKPFVILTGNSGTGKTKLAQLLAHWMTGSVDASPVGYAVVPVGADWTDNRNVVGFVNHLRKDGGEKPIYQSTPVLDLLLRALADPSRPYFLILDEMNLSHVERYFSDFLSAMESKTPVPIHQEKEPLLTPSGATVRPSVDFPENLFVAGTVNVDETTYMFSPKVLDRANVLEFRIDPGQAKGFLESADNRLKAIVPNPEAARAFLELSRRARGLTEPALPPIDEAALAECQRSLQDLFAILHHARLEFAFRTLAEVMRYLRVDFALSARRSDWQWQRCLDAQILQKILPKLHGSRRRLEGILIALATYCEKRDAGAAQKPLQRDSDLNAYPSAMSLSDVQFQLSRTKLLEMIEAVRRDQFVSFIQ
jgi:hypothetical protein